MARFRYVTGGIATITQTPPPKPDLLPSGPITWVTGDKSIRFAVPFDREWNAETHTIPKRVHVVVYRTTDTIIPDDPRQLIAQAPANGATDFPSAKEPFGAGEVVVGVGVNTSSLFNREAELDVPWGLILEFE